MTNKIFIAGCGGMLGDAFYKIFKEDYELLCTDIDTNESWLSYLDFRNFDEYFNQVKKFNPNYLFHLGALTSLEECENNIKNAYLTNTTSVENACYISNQLDIPLIFISTAGIFDGKKDTYNDWDQPNPISVYAHTKYEAEKFIISNSNKYLICRAGWMMGGGPKKDKKFVNKIIKQINEGKKILNIVNDRFGTPTYTIDFAKNLKLILEKEFWGLYNLVCEGLTSRMDVTRAIIKYFNLESKIQIKEVDSSFFSKEYFAPRPYSERLINYKLSLRDLNKMNSWEKSLKQYLSSYKFL